MRALRRLSTMLAATALAAAGCAAPGYVGDPLGGDRAADEPAPVQAPAAQPTHHQEPTAEVALCTVLPKQLVGDLVDARIIDAAGEGSQCTWRLQVPSPASSEPDDGSHLAGAPADDPTLQGAFLDVGAFHAGRPPAGDPGAVADLAGVGDEAFVVHLGDASPSTLYVREGDRALSLWLQDAPMAPQDTERSLARVASLLLDLA
ncbi:MAG: hypothetical protein ACLGIC_02390 [Acidimicrobiia bacterium]